MLRLRSSILAPFLSSPRTYPGLYLHRLLSAAAPAVSPNPRFALEEYLVDTCGLTQAQALKASPKLSHLKCPSKPDAVLAFLAGLGLSSTNVAAVVAKDPKFLCTAVERTLAPNVVDLTGVGLSHTQIARLVSLAPHRFRCRSVVSSVHYCLPLFGSSDKLLRAINHSSDLLSCNLEKVVKPNVAFLQECGIDAIGIALLCLSVPRILGTKPERVQAMAARAEAVGVPRGSGMFRQALHAVALLSEEKIAVKVEYLKNTFRWSDAEVWIAVCKAPSLLRSSTESLQRKSRFLISEVGLEPAHIAHRPAMISYSLEGRLMPRYYVVKFLKGNGLLKRNPSYYTVVNVTEKVFVEKFICPHKEVAPNLSGYYAAACRGEAPTNFRFM